MSTQAVDIPIAYTLFCDDLREEQGNKYSAMGVYTLHMVLDAETMVLPKFVALTVLQLPNSSTIRTASLKFIDGEVTLLSEKFDIPADPTGGLTGCLLAVPVEVAPFEARVGMSLHVHISVDEIEYRSQTFRIVDGSAPHVTLDLN